MQNYQRDFIDTAISCQALQFGEFKLKSGRISPYFFNAGRFYTGSALSSVGKCYAAAIVDKGIEFDFVFGPAYKGITLAAATCIALAEHHRINAPYCYNRKEAKSHGEGGLVVGAPLMGKALVVDDVITAGTAIRDVLAMLEGSEAQIGAIVVGLDRQEKGTGQNSAIQELRNDIGVAVSSIIGLQDIMSYLAAKGEQAVLSKVEDYRDRYGV